MENMKQFIIYGVLCFWMAISHGSQNLGLGDRPAQVQNASDKAFKDIKDTVAGEWRLYDGSWSSGYGLVDLDEDELFEQFAHKDYKEKNIYIIDAGCAQGGWGKHAFDVLKDDRYSKSGKHFHIFSVTGGKECRELTERKGHVTLYQFNQFKIENIDEEFTKRGFDLKNKVNLIVSNWTLRHVVDPFGTVKRMYGLLSPQQGKLMSNGFLFKLSDDDEIQEFPLGSQMGNENILIASNATCLFKNTTAGRNIGHFLLERNDNKELEIPLEYDGNIYNIGCRWQNESHSVTVFNKKNLDKTGIEYFYMNEERKIYCDKYDKKCQDLYKFLLNQKMFYTS
jgi:hypothetical protein